MRPCVLVSCEHGGNGIPPAYRRDFARHRALLESHRGYDPGALALARDLARACNARLLYSTTSRLLVELNRSPGHPQLYSEITRALPAGARRELLARYYLPYRAALERWIVERVRSGRRVVHVSAHSFTPVLHGLERHADVGFLYDPARAGERAFCTVWRAALRERDRTLAVRRNYPYRGVSDGLPTHLRRHLRDRCYIGVELEVNQKHPLGPAHAWHALRRAIVGSFAVALDTL